MICPRCKGRGELPDTIGELIRTEREALGGLRLALRQGVAAFVAAGDCRPATG